MVSLFKSQLISKLDSICNLNSSFSCNLTYFHVPEIRTWTSLGDYYSAYRIIGLTTNNTDLTYIKYLHSVPDLMLTTSHRSLHLIFTIILWGKYYSICLILKMSELELFFPIYFSLLISPVFHFPNFIHPLRLLMKAI